MDDAGGELIPAAAEAHQQPTPPPPDSQEAGPAERHIAAERSIKRMDTEDETMAPDMPSPISADGEKHDESELPALNCTDLGSPSMGYEFSNVRVCIKLNPVYLL
jgi:glucose-induced degradation protein 4